MSVDLRTQYLDAIRLHLWYRGSKFSFHQGKASKELAKQYKDLAHHLHAEIQRGRRAA